MKRDFYVYWCISIQQKSLNNFLATFSISTGDEGYPAKVTFDTGVDPGHVFTGTTDASADDTHYNGFRIRFAHPFPKRTSGISNAGITFTCSEERVQDFCTKFKVSWTRVKMTGFWLSS